MSDDQVADRIVRKLRTAWKYTAKNRRLYYVAGTQTYTDERAARSQIADMKLAIVSALKDARMSMVTQGANQ